MEILIPLCLSLFGFLKIHGPLFLGKIRAPPPTQTKQVSEGGNSLLSNNVVSNNGVIFIM